MASPQKASVTLRPSWTRRFRRVVKEIRGYAFAGVLSEKTRPIWICEHDHDSSMQARRCAEAELERRRG